jgi:hypothetical protein
VDGLTLSPIGPNVGAQLELMVRRHCRRAGVGNGLLLAAGVDGEIAPDCGLAFISVIGTGRVT